MMTPKRTQPACEAGCEGTSGYVRTGQTHRTTTRRPTPPSAADRRAIDAYYGADDPRAALLSVGLTVSEHNNGTHWVISGHNLRINHWPTKNKWRVFGRSWVSSADAVIRAIKAGRFRMPAEARAGTCKHCGEPIWWLRTDNDLWQPTDADGDCHLGRCGGSS